MNLSQAKRVQRLLAGGLYTADQDGLRCKDAAVRVAAAQLRAIRFALTVDDASDAPSADDGRPGWCPSDDRFDRSDAFIALGGVMALLDATHNLCDEVAYVVAELETIAAVREADEDTGSEAAQ